MTNLIRLLLITCSFSFAVSVRGQEKVVPKSVEANAAKVFLNSVQPLLENKCWGCHGMVGDLSAGLILRTRKDVLKGGEHGPAIVPGNAAKSLLYQHVTGARKPTMPPKRKNRLTNEEIVAVKYWLDGGAPWPETKPDPKNPKWKIDPKDAWAFQPVKKHTVPSKGIDPKKIRTPIDAFLLQTLQRKKLTFAASADRATLIRRATYDLIGLPPTAKEIRDFVNDRNPNAFEKVIERLLASPHYGEHWGRHWLDVVRYADSAGFSNDFERPNAWRYRDYVIRSFNNDKPYDRFVMEQIAGDELEPNNPEMHIATGFLRMGPWEHTGMSVAAVTRQMFLDDVTDSVGTTFLAVTLNCCRCHDHKFDPLPTRDYYRFQAIFAPVQFEKRNVPFLAKENTNGFQKAMDRLQQRMKTNQARLASIRANATKRLQALLATHNVKRIQDLPKKLQPRDKRFGLTKADMERERIYRKRLAYYKLELDRYKALAFSVSTGGLKKKIQTPPTHILVGGQLNSPSEKVTPGVLSAVYASNDVEKPTEWNTIPQSMKERRLALAKWIASPKNPLTARVIVNRIWQYHFGKGIVTTSNNFGKMGKRPTHPQLLDWLAQQFVAKGWSVKAMHRFIMKSAAYQQSSVPANAALVKKVDPLNQMLSFFPPRRLTAEEIRDSILTASGNLNLKSGGPGIFPEINLDLALQPRQIMGTLAPIYEPSPSRKERYRRTVYVFVRRSLANPLLDVFNAPNSNKACEIRNESTVTPQVFAMFNSQWFNDMSLAMAKNISDKTKKQDEQIDLAFSRAFGRTATKTEKSKCLDHLRKMSAHHQRTEPVERRIPNPLVMHHIGELTGTRFTFVADWDLQNYEFNLRPSEVPPSTRALADLCLVLLNANEFLYVY